MEIDIIYQELSDNLAKSEEIITKYYDDIEEPEFDLGILHALNNVLFEIKKSNKVASVTEHIKSHCEFVFNLEANFINSENEKAIEYRKWANPIAMRISDEMAFIDDESKDVLKATIDKLLFHNPSFIKDLIGTHIIEEDYFDKLA